MGDKPFTPRTSQLANLPAPAGSRYLPSPSGRGAGDEGAERKAFVQSSVVIVMRCLHRRESGKVTFRVNRVASRIIGFSGGKPADRASTLLRVRGLHA